MKCICIILALSGAPPDTWYAGMAPHMSASMQALCYFYRNPPPGSGVKPQPYKAIPKLIKAPSMEVGRVKMAVRRFHLKRQTRGRKVGWRKTTPAEDATIFSCFKRVRQPLGSLVEARDVWRALPVALRSKVTMRTVLNRLRDKGFSMHDKLAGDDLGEKWRLRRLAFSKTHAGRTARQWTRRVQAVADFRYFVYFPKKMKTRHKRKSAPRTIMHQRERKKAPFLKPRSHVFKRSEYKCVQKVKVFGLTTSAGASLLCHVPTQLRAADWVKLVKRRIGPFMRQAFPQRKTCTLLLDGETLMHTPEAKAAMREAGLKPLPDWPSHSPDLNPQENVWAWAEPKLRKAETMADSFEKFKQRVAVVCQKYPGGRKLVPSLAHRMELCLQKAGGSIRK